ncbi:MAG: hypothetical protein CMQ40_07850 [Gammaproteobacteria bacterium]|nr:hypothetical protein [Gammaproteobacteria bacterium]
MILPTYVLPLPMEVCRKVAGYLLHPNMIVRRYADQQRAYISDRIEETMHELEKKFDQYDIMDYMSAWYLLERIRRIMWRQQRLTSEIVRLTNTMGPVTSTSIHSVDAHIRDLSIRSTWPIYLLELKTWFLHDWHHSFLRRRT